jgi:hypothetical protein
MAESDSTQLKASERDVDSLVEEVRERLCLKSREKLNAARRAMPYSQHGRKGSAFVYGSDKRGSPQGGRASSSKHFCNSCLKKCYSCKCSSSSKSEDFSCLQQLLAERRLIQEAVRRVLHHQYGDSASALEPASSPTSFRSSSTDSMDSSTFSSTAEL